MGQICVFREHFPSIETFTMAANFSTRTCYTAIDPIYETNLKFGQVMSYLSTT